VIDAPQDAAPRIAASHVSSAVRRRLAAAAVAVAVSAIAALVAPSAPRLDVDPVAFPTSAASAEQSFFTKLNQTRAANGKPQLVLNTGISSGARTWSGVMASTSTLAHDPGYAAAIAAVVPDWTRVAENVGYGSDVDRVHNAFYASAGHRANMLGDFNQVGIGVVLSGSRVWVTVRFAKGTLPAPDPGTYALRNALSAGTPDARFDYGLATDRPNAGDWDGDGVDTVAVRRGATFYLRNSNSGGPSHHVFTYGRAGDTPIYGDWNGDGKDTIGVRRGNVFYLRNSNSGGPAHVAVVYGSASDAPIVGDWNGDGRDTVGVKRGAMFYLRNSNTGGSAQIGYAFGSPGDAAISGDWDGDGADTIGLRRDTAFYLTNRHAGGAAAIGFYYGAATDAPVAGDWNGDGRESAGVRSR
jgi:uncharacterized protein YkwD